MGESESPPYEEPTDQTAGSAEQGEQSSQAEQARILSWLARRDGTVVAWVIPVLVVAITGAIGSSGHPLVTATWLAIVGGGAAGVITNAALAPAPYAKQTAPTVGAVVGVIILALLAWQSGEPLLT